LAAYEFTSLAFQGFHNSPLPNLFLRQADPPTTLAVLYPGLNYTCDMPLLYYSTGLLLRRGVDVLQVKADYTAQAFQSRPPDERAGWLLADSAAALQAGLTQRSYARVILIGKSIGTIALAGLIACGAAGGAANGAAGNAAIVWLTPLLHQSTIVEAALAHQGPGLFVVGTADRTYDAAALARILEETAAEALYVEGGDHRLEIESDLYRSLDALRQIMLGIERFIDRLASPAGSVGA
jgi:predicted alpha/beta-hydrolase family hydrolase